MIDGFRKYIKKKVFIVLKNGNQFNGIVEEVNDVGDDIIFISITDKYNKWFTFQANEIELIQEKKGGKDGSRG